MLCKLDFSFRKGNSNMKITGKGKRTLSMLLALAMIVTILSTIQPVAFSKEMGQKPSTEEYKKYIGCNAWFNGLDTPLTTSPENVSNPFYVSETNAVVLFSTSAHTSVKLVIVDCYYNEAYDTLWYKVQAAPGFTLPTEVVQNPWVYQDYVINAWNEPSLKISEPETVTGTVTDSAGNPVVDSNGKPLTVTVTGGLPEGAELEASIPEINGEKRPNVFDIKVYDANGNEWQPIDEGKSVIVSIPVDTDAEYVDVLHYVDYEGAVHESITYIPTGNVDAAILEAFADAIAVSKREGYIAVEQFDNVCVSNDFVLIQASSFSIYEWTSAGYQKIPGTGDVTEVLFRNDQISATNREFEYWASPGQTFMLTTATGSYEDDPFNATSEDITLVNTRGDYAGLFTGYYRHATVTILNTAQVGSEITINFNGSFLNGEIIIHIIREVNITFDKNLDKSTLTNTSYGPVATDGIRENLFTIPTDAGYIPTPTDAHYTFVGWNTSPDGTGTSYTYDEKNKTFSPSAFTPMMDLTLYAMWSAENSVVKFNPNGGEGTYDDVSVKTGASVILPQGPTRKDYVFLGWSATKDGYSTPFAAGSEYTVHQDTTLYAIWGVDLTVTYSGGTLLLQKEGDFEAKPLLEHKYTNGQPVFIYEPVTADGVTTYQTVLLEGFLKNARFTFKYAENYKANDPASTGAAVKFTKQTNQIIADISSTDGINVNTTISFSAVPQGEKSYIISYNTNYGTPLASTVLQGLENATLQLTELPDSEATTRTGYTLEGWYLDAALTQKATVPMVINGNVTLYAKWIPNSYTAKWIVDGVVVEEKEYAYNTQLVKPANPSKTGYSFVGWSGYTNAMTMPANDVTFIAQFDINQYTITFNSAGGSAIAAIIQVYDSEIIPPAAPTRVGYFFAGWDTEIPLTMPAENMTITAVWEKITYSVYFLESNGTPVAGIANPFTFDIDSLPTLQLPLPEKSGQTFLGWYKTSELVGDPCNALTLAEELLKQNDRKEVVLELYAKWEVSLTSMTIQITGCNTTLDPKQSFLLNVVGTDGVNLTVTVLENGVVTIHGVTIGETYTVTMEDTWSWRYEEEEPQSKEIVAGASDNVFTFSVNRHSNDPWLDGNDCYSGN